LNTAGAWVAGQVREDPSNITSAINLGQDTVTELEFVLTPTANTVDQNLCFRVTNNGTDLDTYLSVAQLRLRFDPGISNFALNDGDDISLVPGATTTVYALGTVTDLNGYTDLAFATTTFYRSGVTGGALCTPNNNDCYVSQCSFTNCSGNSCEVSCAADMYFHTDPTDPGSNFEGQEWLAFLEVEDLSAGYDFDTSLGQDVLTLPAIAVNSSMRTHRLKRRRIPEETTPQQPLKTKVMWKLTYRLKGLICQMVAAQ
jgi:hypothetical protein